MNNIILYEQVKESLRQEIVSGKRRIGGQLPNEMVLCQTYRVSRITVRRAIEELCSEGLLEKIHGKGTFITSNQPKKNDKKFWRIIIPKYTLFHDIMHAAESSASQYGYNLVFSGGETAEDIERSIKQDHENGITGYILMPSYHIPFSSSENNKMRRILSNLRIKKIPFVLINRTLKRYNFDCVAVNHRLGGFLATKHLLDHGFQRIAYLALPGHSENIPRLESYMEALKEANITKTIVKEIKQWEGNPKCGYREAKELLAKKRPQAIFVFGDSIALQVFSAARDSGVKVPEELAVVGYDDRNDSLVPPISLTSVNQNFSEVGRLAVQILLKRSRGDWSDFPQKLKVDPFLVIRQSCGCECKT